MSPTIFVIISPSHVADCILIILPCHVSDILLEFGSWPSQSAFIVSTPRPIMTWPTTAPPPTSTPQPVYPIEPQHYSINPPHMPGTTPTPVEHLFGQPSALHPTWPSSTSPQPTTSTMPPPSFTSLATAPHAVPATHLVPTTPQPLGPDTTTFHSASSSFCNSNGTGFPNDMANRSGSSSDTDHTTHTSTKITLPTSSSSTSTSGYHDINSSSSCPSTYGSQSSPKGSIREETRQNTPLSSESSIDPIN